LAKVEQQSKYPGGAPQERGRALGLRLLQTRGHRRDLGFVVCDELFGLVFAIQEFANETDARDGVFHGVDEVVDGHRRHPSLLEPIDDSRVLGGVKHARVHHEDIGTRFESLFEGHRVVVDLAGSRDGANRGELFRVTLIGGEVVFLKIFWPRGNLVRRIVWVE
jgi:hypothetical protein